MKSSISTILLIISLFFCVFQAKLYAQTTLWARQFGGSADSSINSITTDSSNNLYLTGYFRGTNDFDMSSSGTFNLSSSNADFYILKLDPNSNFIWAKKIGSTGNDFSTQIELDNAGNIYIRGTFNGTIDFNPDPLVTFNLTATTSNTPFILKLKSNGDFLWVKSFDNISFESFSLDSTSDIIFSGRFTGTKDFNPSITDTTNLTSNGSGDFFLLKLDTNGDFVWVKQIGASLNERLCHATVDTSDNIIMTGSFAGTVDFNPDTSGIFSLNSLGGEDFFILKLDTTGSFIWAKQIGASSTIYGSSVITDSSNNIYASGTFEAASAPGVDFDPGTNTHYLNSYFFGDPFALKLNANGDFIWAEDVFSVPASGSDSFSIEDIALDATNNLFLVGNGWFPGLGPRTFIEKISSSGNLEFFEFLDGTGGNSAKGITLGDAGDLFISGYYDEPDYDAPLNFSFNDIPITLYPNGAPSSFLMRLASTTALSTTDFENNKVIIAYPNPVTNSLFIENKQNKKLTVSLYTITGMLIQETKGNDFTLEMNLSGIASGVYLAKITNGDDIFITKKIIKQ